MTGSNAAPPSDVPLEFPIRIQANLKPILLLFGVHDDGRATVRIGGGEFSATFGRFGARTPLANIESWDITGPYNSLRAVA